MALNVEWRINHGADAIVVVDRNEGSVAEALTPDAGVLREFLAVTGNLERWRGWTGWHAVDRSDRDPDAWGELVIGRKDDGEVIEMDPELFWQAVHRWFRSRGVDYNT
jgi:hypothetical protein